MADNARLVIEHIGCEEGLARLALAMCDNNVDDAVNNFEQLMSGASIIKGKVRSKITGVHGLFLGLLDVPQHRFVRIATVLTDDPSVYDTTLNGNWFVLERKIYTVRLCAGWLQNATREMEHRLFHDLQAEHATAFFDAVKERKYDETKALLHALISEIQALPNLELELIVEHMGSAYHTTKKVRPQAVYDVPTEQTEHGMETQIELMVQLVHNGSDTIHAQDLVRGDMVMTEIVDDRDIARYIAHLLGGLEGDQRVPLYAVVEDIVRDGVQMHVKLRFSPGIAGIAHAAPTDRVKRVGKEMGFIQRIRKFFATIF